MDNKNLGVKLANAFCTIVAVCGMALIIAITAKLIMWIF